MTDRLENIATRLRSGLSMALCKDDFDIVQSPDQGDIEVMTDEWTLRIEGDTHLIAWLALENEPEDEELIAEARRQAMGLSVEHALAAVDHRMDGTLTTALRASGDPLSISLADALNELQTGSSKQPAVEKSIM